MESGKQPFNLPSAFVSAQASSVLCGFLFPVNFMRRDQIHPLVLNQLPVQRVAVISLISDQTIGISACKAVLQGFMNQSHFMWRSASNPQCHRKTMALRNCHDLGPFASLCLTNSKAPFSGAPGMGAPLEVQVLPEAGHSDRTEAQGRKGDRPSGGSVKGNPWADVQKPDTRRCRPGRTGQKPRSSRGQRGSGVNPAVVWRRGAFLPGETSPCA